MKSKPATKKVQRRPLRAPEERPTRQREAEAGSAYASDPDKKLSVDIPLSLHVALKQYVAGLPPRAGNTVHIKDWLSALIRDGIKNEFEEKGERG